MPDNFLNALIIAFYKNKGNKSDCGNYSISVLSTTGMIFAHILLNGLFTPGKEPPGHTVLLLVQQSHSGVAVYQGTSVNTIFASLQSRKSRELWLSLIFYIDVSPGLFTNDTSNNRRNFTCTPSTSSLAFVGKAMYPTWKS